jgi:uncharacterized protein YbaA (DUF1428 family)
MSESNTTESKELGNQVRLYLYKTPKKNHDAIVENQRQFAETFRKYGSYYRSFQLDNTEVPEGFISMVNVLSANQEEEVWLDLESYRDRKHMDEVVTKIENDEYALSLMNQYLGLLSSSSRPILAKFSRQV